MDSGLRGKVVLVTGASGGIGRACAQAFAQEGARLILHAHRNLAKAERLAEELDAEAIAIGADLRDEAAVASFFAQAVERFVRLDAVVVNAGAWPRKPAPVYAMSLAQWRDTLETNLTSAFLCARYYFRFLDVVRPESASLVFVGSTAALFGEENHADYAASKAGMVHGLAKSLKNEIVRLVPAGRVNAVCPGWTRTPMAEADLEDTETVAKVLQTCALKKIAEPQDVANAVVFLSSDKLAGHISGENITVAGGMEGRLLHTVDQIDPEMA